MTIGHKLAAIVLLAFSLIAPGHAWNETADYWKCQNRVSGSWQWGIAPYGCDGSVFGADAHLLTNYNAVIFQQARDYSSERARYMQEMYALLREASAHYIKSRKPSVSAAELAAFQRATFAVAYQESYWSHYRKASQDGRYKMMRGDFGHGHGLMQVDDRAHYTAATQGKGWELMQNIYYSLDEYYTAWQRAPSQSCVSSASDWRSRARAAYSAYNGGPARICRWTNPGDTWARNDNGFRDKYDGQAWLSYVADRNMAAKVNVKCLAGGGSNCPVEKANPDHWYGKVVRTPAAEACVYDGKGLHCMADLRHVACLSGVGNFDSATQVTAAEHELSGLSKRVYDPHQTCHDVVAGLAPVGSVIQLSRSNNLRSTPNGDLIHAVEGGAVLQVLDLVVMDNASHKRFYQVSHKGKTGYIWGGSDSDYRDWSTPTLDQAGSYLLPVHGQWLQLKNNTNLRASPAGTLVTTLAAGTQLQVKSLHVTGAANDSYALVETATAEGWIYTGRLGPAATTTEWFTPTTSSAATKAALCPDASRYDGALGLCRDDVDSYGPFPAALVQQCINAGGGEACNTTVKVAVPGGELSLQRWSTALLRQLRGSQDCAPGSSRDVQYGYHCVERNSSGTVTDVYGPFGSVLVERCLGGGGGLACYSNRWSAGGYRAWRGN